MSSGGIQVVRQMATVLAIVVCICVISITCFAAEETGKWRLEAGISYRGNMETTVKGGSRARSAFIEATQPAQSIPAKGTGNVAFPRPELDTEIGDRDFDDGFVYTDALTENDNLTVNFGYQNNSQNNSTEGVLAFHRKNDVSGSEFLGKGIEYRKIVRTKYDEVIDSSKHFGAGGLKVNARYDLVSRGRATIALSAGVRGFFGMDNSVKDSNFGQTITENRVSYRDYYLYSGATKDTYTFSYGGSIPPAPYSNPNGNPFADPLISNIPDSVSRDVNIEGATRRDYRGRQVRKWETANQIEIDTDVDLFQLALGGEVTYQLFSAATFSLQPLLLVNFVSAEVMRNEQLVGQYLGGETRSLARWQDKKSSSSVCLGAALEAGVNVKLGEGWFAGITAGYEWVDETSVTVGPNEIDIDLSGFTTSFVIGVRF